MMSGNYRDQPCFAVRLSVPSLDTLLKIRLQSSGFEGKRSTFFVVG